MREGNTAKSQLQPCSSGTSGNYQYRNNPSPSLENATVITPIGRSPSAIKKACRVTSFNPNPEVIPPMPSDQFITDDDDISSSRGLVWKELKEAREASRKKIRRIVAMIGIIFVTLCIILVGVSLMLGSKIDDLVQEGDHKKFITKHDEKVPNETSSDDILYN